jgi:pimeloyl-ACP methyl ester carboxylesterase
LISGSGAQDRDESLAPVASIRPFRLIAEYLTPLGIAVLRYDDRGTGQSTGDFESATMAEFVTDGAAALQFLLEHPAIDPDQIGILGHSEGGAIAPQITVENPGAVAFIISMAGTALPGDEVLLWQNQRIMEVSGASEEEIAGLLEHAERVYGLAVAQDPGLEAAVRAQLLYIIEITPEEDLAQIEDIDAYIDAQTAALIEAYNADWYRYFLEYNPGDYWPNVGVPVLALFGGLDVQVDAVRNAAEMEALLADNPDVQIVTFPTANHLFQDAVTGAVEEYGELESEFLPDFLPTISEWLLEQVRTASE